jgi:hypothetical protein
MREDRKKTFPEQFAAQEARRDLWQRAKAAGKTAKTTVVRGFVDDTAPTRAMEKRCQDDLGISLADVPDDGLTERRRDARGSQPWLHDDDETTMTADLETRYGAVEECGCSCLLNAAVNDNHLCLPAVVHDNTTTTTTTQRTTTNDDDKFALSTAGEQLRSGKFEGCLLEVCCAVESELARCVPERWLAIRITTSTDVTKRGTKRMIHELIRLCVKLGVRLHTWVSVPCTAGCR